MCTFAEISTLGPNRNRKSNLLLTIEPSIYVLPSQLSQHLVTHVVETELANQTVQPEVPAAEAPREGEQELGELLIGPAYAYI